MTERGAWRAFTTLSRDIQLALIAGALLLLEAGGEFLLGASGPGLTRWIWLLVWGAYLGIASGLAFGVFRLRRVWWALFVATGLFAGTWTQPYNIIAVLVVFPSLFVLLPVATVLSLAAIPLSLIRHDRRGRESVLRIILLIPLLFVTIRFVLPSPASWIWNLDYGALLAGLHMAATSRVDPSSLQSSAVELLEREGPRLATQRKVFYYRPQDLAQLPGPIQDLHPRGVMLLAGEDEEEDYVRLSWGRGIMPTWGIKVGPPTFRLASDERVRRWREGIYGFRGD